MTDARDKFIGSVVRGKSFADVGGLWGTVNEKVSVAHQHGATELTMIDVTVEGGELWQKFQARMSEKKITDYRCIASDLFAVEDLSFDVVHCSGVLYHHPDPQGLLAALRRLTREHLVLSSAITQESIHNSAGSYEIPPSGVIFVPALSEAERAVLTEYWKPIGVEAHGITHAVEFKPNLFGPWWWLPTAKAMEGMARAAGYEVLDAVPTWGGNAHTLKLRPN